MRTRNRLLPVLLLVLAASTLAAITAPVAKAYMRPPTQVVIDPGDPDDPASACRSAAPPSSGEPIRPADRSFPASTPRASELEAGTATLPTLHMSKWQLRDILFYLLFQAPNLR